MIFVKKKTVVHGMNRMDLPFLIWNQKAKWYMRHALEDLPENWPELVHLAKWIDIYIAWMKIRVLKPHMHHHSFL